MDTLLSGQLLFAALVSGSLYALVALGLNLVYGTLRLLNIAHGDLVMIGAYTAFGAFSLFHLPPVISVFLAAAVCAGLGWAVYEGLFRRLLANPTLAKRVEANSLILFYGISVILQNVVAMTFTASSRGYQYLDTVITWGGVSMTGNRLLTLIVASAVCFGTLLFLRHTLFGWSLRAVIERREAAQVVGVNLNRVQLITICAGFAAAGVAGTLVSMTEQITPFMGFPFTIVAFVVIIVGGLGNIGAGVLAGFCLGLVETYGIALTSPGYRSILIYGLFVAVLLIRPEGVFSKAVRS
ncbi:branched-chain amino acid ABC transporter permease [Chachezhania sediminis]|uniref:branched-chain amino acid ABC transporter permease n=1 Tax=Chachezhania sediminis TaxID=2599291 RepID=UPI00131DCE0B|nr:branched-chain amino acid ABC transporter permease [Chachezhania sediminis]